MRALMGLLLAFGLLLSAGQALAEVRDVYEFETRAQEQRFQSLLAVLRCPKCQNQNIADSNAPISKDMRDAVYRMMQNGASDAEITNELVSRFGEFVRYKPKVDQRTIVLWATPALVVFIGVVIVLMIVRRSTNNRQKEAPLTDEERARAAQLLNERDRRDENAS